jgi:hypothetical protein
MTQDWPALNIFLSVGGSAWRLIGGPNVTILSAAITMDFPASHKAPMQTVIRKRLCGILGKSQIRRLAY